MAAAPDRRSRSPPTEPEDMALLHFTSGTTGTPKGAVHVHEAVVAHHATGSYALDLHPDDVFWCTADPGWVTGTSYGIIAPLTHGVTSIVDEADFDAERWYRHPRTRAGHRLVHRADRDPDADAGRRGRARGATTCPRCASSPASASRSTPRPWSGAQEAFGLPIHDNWWQTETGGIMIANYAAHGRSGPARWAGRCPASRPAIVRATTDGTGRDGEPSIDRAGRRRASWRCGRAGRRCSAATSRATSATAQCFAGGWYLTGDLARRDADGYFWFVGRADDVIKSAGHLIGPFEVESALMEHPAVAEAGVIGKPDPVAGEVVKAFVALQARLRADRGAAPRAARLRPQAARRRRRAQGDRLRRRPAEDPQRQDHAPPAQGPRARPARGRPVDAGERHDATPTARAARSTASTRRAPAARRCCASAASRSAAPSSTAPPKIRGFLHLYIGEEAVAVGRHAARSSPTTPSSPPTASTATPWPAASPIERDDGRDVRQGRGLQPRPRRLDAPLRRARRASTAATPSSAAGCRSPSAWRWPTRCRAATASPPASSARAPWPRASSTSRMNLAALWQLPVLFCCENNLYAMGTALERSESETDLALQGRRLRRCRPGPVDGMDVAGRRGRRAPRGRRDPRAAAARTSSSCAPTASAPTRCTTPSCYRDKAEVEAWKRARPDRRAAARLTERRACSTTTSSRPIEAEVARRGRRTPSPSPRPGTLEPVEDLDPLRLHASAAPA